MEEPGKKIKRLINTFLIIMLVIIISPSLAYSRGDIYSTKAIKALESLLDADGSLTNLSVFAATTSAQLYGVLSDETGSASGTPLAVFNQSPTLVTPTLGVATATTLDTGQGANELYDMDQNVLTTSSPTFAGLAAMSMTMGAGTAATDIVWTFDGETNDGTFSFKEDEDAFAFKNARVEIWSTGSLVDSFKFYESDGVSYLALAGDTSIYRFRPNWDGGGVDHAISLETYNYANQLFVATSGNIGIQDNSPDYQLEQYDATNTPSYAMSDDDIAHGLTTLAQTDIFYHVTSISTTVGGTQVTSITDADGVAYLLRGVIGAINPTDTTPAVRIIGAISDGSTGIADMGAAETVFAVANNDNADGFRVLGNNNIVALAATITLSGLAGTTEDWLCIDANEQIIRKSTACSGV